MVQIKKLKDVITTQDFYPITHVDAIVGLKDMLATEYVTLEMRDADIAAYNQDQIVVAGALNVLHEDVTDIYNILSWQDE